MTPPARTIPLAAPDIGPEELRLVQEALQSQRLASGPMLVRFEEAFANRFGARFAIGVSNGTAALHLAMIAAGVHDGDLVITTPFSFIASANAILYERGIPIFVDVDPETLTIDPQKSLEVIEEIVNRKPGWRHLLPRNCNPTSAQLRAIVPIHIFGRPAQMKEIVDCAHTHQIAVVEDACEAIGAESDGVFAGRWGDASAFGFYPNKQITTGEGGMLLTDNEEWARLFRSLRNQGRAHDDQWFRHDRLGFNYRLDELSAALGLAQFNRLDELLARREAVANRYSKLLADVDGVTPLAAPRAGMRLSWFLYPVRLAPDLDRDEMIAALEKQGIMSRPYFWPIHLQPFYRERFGFQPGDFPHSEAAGHSLLSLPMFPGLTPEEIGYIVSVVGDEIKRARSSRRGVAIARS
ncbi:MAG: perosamine synthetase [Acidobacteriota bacterium]|jgi:dTDP-4-amino-4,6-dideoxygalactose transaminase|nr:perosamine synthetase [Acidobacteriota bacterium]